MILYVLTSVKTCTKCGVEKDLEDFHKHAKHRDGRSAQCRVCRKALNATYYADNRERVSVWGAEYRARSPEARCAARRKRREANREKINAGQKLWRDQNPERSKFWVNDWNQRHKDHIKKRNAAKYLRDKDKIAEQNAANREAINKAEREKFANNPEFRLAKIIRARFFDARKRRYKTGSAVRDLGCSIGEFNAHLSSLFQPGMTWENEGSGEGKWNIDHIMPLSVFDLSKRQQFLLAVHYLNQRPLWWKDNLAKSDNLPEEVLEWQRHHAA